MTVEQGSQPPFDPDSPEQLLRALKRDVDGIHGDIIVAEFNHEQAHRNNPTHRRRTDRRQPHGYEVTYPRDDSAPTPPPQPAPVETPSSWWTLDASDKRLLTIGGASLALGLITQKLAESANPVDGISYAVGGVALFLFFWKKAEPS